MVYVRGWERMATLIVTSVEALDVINQFGLTKQVMFLRRSVKTLCNFLVVYFWGCKRLTMVMEMSVEALSGIGHSDLMKQKQMIQGMYPCPNLTWALVMDRVIHLKRVIFCMRGWMRPQTLIIQKFMSRTSNEIWVRWLRGSSSNWEKINSQGCALVVVVQLWIWFYFDSLHSSLDFLLSLIFLDMEPCIWKPLSPSVRSSNAAKEVMTTTKFYEDFFPKEDKDTMSGLEAKVCFIREFKVYGIQRWWRGRFSSGWINP